MDLLIFEEQRWVLYIFRIGDISVYESQDVLLSPPYPIALLLLKEAQEKELHCQGHIGLAAHTLRGHKMFLI